jgi:hypothetical protein
MSFEYLLSKIDGAHFESSPFPHLYIRDFFNEGHFQQIVSAPEISVKGLSSDDELFDALFDKGYKIIGFPGCITDRRTYVKWRRSKDRQRNHNNTACEGFGVTLRLMAPSSPIISELKEFLDGDVFQGCLAAKFGINMGEVTRDSGIQKYLDGYEISPHPDIRKKALTYMVNVNPGSRSEQQEHHTHYLRFRKEFQYVQTYWEGNAKLDRCWVPWDWCDTVKQQRENNSIVVFSPSNATMHGVKANYDHLASQRTQLYGNLWYKTSEVQDGPEWEDLVLTRFRSRRGPDASVMTRLKARVPEGIKIFLKNKMSRAGANVVPDRLKKDY